MSHTFSLRFGPRFVARFAPMILAAGISTACDSETPAAPLLPNDGRPLFTSHSAGVDELPPLPGAYASVGMGVNDNGDVVGTSWFLDENGAGSLRPTLWPGTGGPPIWLAGGFDGEAHAINNRGDVVGWHFSENRAVIWAGGGAPRYLTPLDANSPFGEAFGINDQGDIVGRNLFNARTRATVWVGGNAPQQLHNTTNFPTVWASYALDINNSGLAVGSLVFNNQSPAPHTGFPVIFTGPTVPPLMLRSVDNSLTNGAAQAINNAGDVAGWADNSQAARRATRWRAPNRVPEDLAPLNNARDAQAFGISDQGDIVGVSGLAGVGRATLWPANGGPAQDLGGPSVSTTARAISPASIYAAGFYTTAAGPIALRFRITGGPPDTDPDGDGIETNVDVNPASFSNAFTDVPRGGTTRGTVLNRGNQILSIVDASAPDGLLISAAPNGGSTPATIELCAVGSSVTLTPGDVALVTCSSVIVSVVTGTVELRLVAADGRIATTSVNAGNGLTFDPATFVVSAPASNNAVITITVDNNPFSLGAGQSVQLQRDASPPTITLANVSVPATAANGATVAYSVSATDDFDPNPVVTCAPPTNSLFAIGSSEVRCTAVDVAGNSRSAAFTVTVLGAPEQIDRIVQLLKASALSQGVKNPLIQALERALGDPKKNGKDCSALDVFVMLVEIKSGTLMPEALATQLIEDATRIKSVLSCLTQPLRDAR